MTNLTQQPVVVEQRDEHAAAIALGFSEWHAIELLGARDNLAKATALAEHFARHRLAEHQRCAKVAEDDVPQSQDGTHAAFRRPDARDLSTDDPIAPLPDFNPRWLLGQALLYREWCDAELWGGAPSAELAARIAETAYARIRELEAQPRPDREAVARAFTRIDRTQYPEIIQTARWSDDDNGTNHFEPGIGFIIDDPDGLNVPLRWVEHLPIIEEALRGLDHTRPHPLDVDTLEYLEREGKEASLTDSAAYCFVCGEHTPMTAMASSSRELWIASRFLNEYFEGWAFDPGSGYAAHPAPQQPRPDREAVKKLILNAWTKAQGNQWSDDLRAGHAADAILALLPAEPVQEMREGDTARTIEILRRALAWHGDPQRMATTREEWQQEIDAAIAWVKANPEEGRPSFSTLGSLLPSEDGWREERERLRAALEYARNLLHLKGVQADEIDEALSEPKEQGERK